jgi:hypothetical protein
MRAILQSLRKRLARSRVEAPEVVSPPAQPRLVVFQVPAVFEQWTTEDVQALRKFLSSDTGLKLVRMCGSHIHTEALSECAGDKAAPKAYGMDQLLRYQFNLASDTILSQVAGDTAAKPNTTGNALDDVEPVELRRSF